VKDAPGWGLTRGERQAVLLVCAAALIGIGYRLYQRSAVPENALITAQDSVALAAIAKTFERQASILVNPDKGDTSAAPHRTQPALPADAPGLLDLNSATQAQLEALPGIGPVLARRILETRDQLGGFQRLDELLEVPGIGQGRLEKIRRLVICRASDPLSNQNLR